MAEPTQVAKSTSGYASVADGATRTTGASFTWQSGDVFLVLGLADDTTHTFQNPTTGGANLTFGAPTTNLGGASNSRVTYWTATATGASSGTIAAVNDGGTGTRTCGISAWQYRNVASLGTPATINGTTAKTINLTRTGTNSHVVGGLCDWNAVNDTTVTATPAGTVDTATNTADATMFVLSWGDQGASGGPTAYGIASHTGTVDMTGVVIEIVGAAAAGAVIQATNMYYARLRH